MASAVGVKAGAQGWLAGPQPLIYQNLPYNSSRYFPKQAQLDHPVLQRAVASKFLPQRLCSRLFPSAYAVGVGLVDRASTSNCSLPEIVGSNEQPVDSKGFCATTLDGQDDSAVFARETTTRIDATPGESVGKRWALEVLWQICLEPVPEFPRRVYA